MSRCGTGSDPLYERGMNRIGDTEKSSEIREKERGRKSVRAEAILGKKPSLATCSLRRGTREKGMGGLEGYQEKGKENRGEDLEL